MKKQAIIGLFGILLFSIAGANWNTEKENSGENNEIDNGFSKLMIQPMQKKATDFTLNDLNGKKVSLNDYKGKIVFLNFWATWCGPCRREMPSMEILHNSMKGKDFVILAVSIRESKSTVESYIRQGKYTFSVLLDPSGKTSSHYPISGIPTTYIVNKKGMIIGKALGGRLWSNSISINMFKALATQ